MEDPQEEDGGSHALDDQNDCEDEEEDYDCNEQEKTEVKCKRGDEISDSEADEPMYEDELALLKEDFKQTDLLVSGC